MTGARVLCADSCADIFVHEFAHESAPLTARARYPRGCVDLDRIYRNRAAINVVQSRANVTSSASISRSPI